MINPEINVLVTGDFCPLHRLPAKIESAGPGEVLGGFLEYLDRSDLSITNLECPLTTAGNPIIKTGPTLKASSFTATFLKQAGFDLITLANNHIMDYGIAGLEDTLVALAENQLAVVGAGQNNEKAARFYVMEKNGIRLAVLNFAENEWSTTHTTQPGANPIDPVVNFRQIQYAKTQADRILVITHGGHEMYRYPSPRMKELFRFYVEAGANAVVNHHTHCTSGYEIYRNAPIFYSLGNFLFDHPDFRHSSWNKGLAVNLNFTKETTSFDLIFFDQCNENAEVILCSEQEGNDRSQDLQSLNQIIASDEKLKKEFNEWILKQNKMYRAYIEPHHNRYIQALQNRGVLSSFWSRRKKQYLLNLLRCESHRDILQSILESEHSHS